MPITINNVARLVEPQDGMPYYRWKAFVEEPPEKLREIRRVIYTLHPTFPKPTQVRDNPEDKFAVEAAGWGEFKILVTVHYKNGSEEIFEYPLDLAKPWPTEAASA